MGEWKFQVSVRVKEDLRRELETGAGREHRTLGNLGGPLMEWAFEQWKAAGGSKQLLRFKNRPKAE